MNNQIIAIIAGLLGGTAVILGAFGTHGLKKILSEKQLTSYEVGVRYQIYHALFILILSSNQWLRQDLKSLAVYFMLIGVILFSGSIYILNIFHHGQKFKFLWPVTPIGGLFIILAWFTIVYAAIIQF